MPTTLTGLLVFVALLLPGFTYVVGKERNGTGQKATPFRETAVVFAASVTFELIILGVFAPIRTLLPTWTPDVGALIRHGGMYLRGSAGHSGHYGQVALWAAGMLAVAIAIAYVATLPRVRTFAAERLGPYPHHSTVSGWWLLFETWQDNRDIRVGCVLDDGSYVEGQLGSFSTDADDVPDRDLILAEPIVYRPPGKDKPAAPYESTLVCISAGRIVTMFVTYTEKPVTSPLVVAAVAGGQASTAAG
jgi:hypothetical protein